jgi:hypothetical protein
MKMLYGDWVRGPGRRTKWEKEIYEAILGPGLAMDLVMRLRAAPADYSKCSSQNFKHTFLIDTGDDKNLD